MKIKGSRTIVGIGLLISLLLGVEVFYVHGFVWGWLSICAFLVNLLLLYTYAVPKNEKKRLGLSIPTKTTSIHVLALVLIGFAFHFFKLDSMPFDLYTFDAARDVVQVQTIVQTRTVYILFENFSKEPFFYHLAALIYPLVRDPFIALKATGAVLGIVSGLVLYGILRRFYKDPTVAFVIAALFLMNTWQLLMERIIVRPALMSLLIMLLMYVLIQALKEGKARYYVWVGILSALGFYVYTPYWIVPGISVAALLVYAPWRKLSWIGYIKNMLIAGLAGLIVLAPLLSFIYQKPDVYFQRINQRRGEVVTLSQKAQVTSFAENYKNELKGLFIIGNSFPPFENVAPYKSALDTSLAVLVIIGMVVSLIMIHNPYSGVSWLFLLGTLIPAAAMSIGFGGEVPNIQRMIGSLVPLLFFAAGAVGLLSACGNYIRKRVKMKSVVDWFLYTCFGIYLLFIGYQSFQAIFVEYPRNYPFENIPLFSHMQKEHSTDPNRNIRVDFFVDPEIMAVYLPDQSRVSFVGTLGVAQYGELQTPIGFSGNPSPLTIYSKEPVSEENCQVRETLASPYGLKIYVSRCRPRGGQVTF